MAQDIARLDEIRSQLIRFDREPGARIQGAIIRLAREVIAYFEREEPPTTGARFHLAKAIEALHQTHPRPHLAAHSLMTATMNPLIDREAPTFEELRRHLAALLLVDAGR
jgi:hypothetical protein